MGAKEKMKEILKKNQAITLVSLVVTIIILIILAGVSLNLTLGQNGIITKAKQAKENTELAKIEEETALNELYMQMESEGGVTGNISYDAIAKLVEFKREIASAISDMGIATEENANASTMASNIRSLSGASSADKVSYDNTNSGLEATNVQGAIDEVNNNLSNKFINYVITQNFTGKQVSIGHTGYKFNEQDIAITTPTGYKPIFAVGLSTNTGCCGFSTCYLSSNSTVHVTMFNSSESIDENPIPVVTVIYIREN